MPRKATDPIEETATKGDLQITTIRQGWLGTDSYQVEVTVTHRVTKKAVLETNDNPYESPHSVRKRAVERLWQEA